MYILTNWNNKVLYTGATSNIARRVFEHKHKLTGDFTKKYNVNKLVFAQPCSDVQMAILAEKKIKAGSRQKKLDLIRSINHEFRALIIE